MTQPMQRQNWSTQKVKYVAALKSGDAITSEDINKNGEYPVYGGNGIRGYTSDYNCNGDYPLIGRQGALCGNINFASGQFWASEHAVVVYPKNNHHARWLGLLLQSMDLNQYSQSAAQPGISVEIIENLTIPVPPRNEQEIISAYLAREILRLDRLVAGKERMLALLEEKRAALISRVVTRGLNPDAPLKDSGQEWLGMIPAHWLTPRSKGLFREVDERTETGEETLLSLRIGKGLVPHKEVSIKKLDPDDLIGFKKIEIGQMVINRMRAASGLIAVATEPGLVSPDYAVFEVTDHGLSIDYFLELFKTPLLQAVFRSSSKGLGTGEQGFLRLYTDSFLALHFPYPPAHEQYAIVAFIKQKCSESRHMESLLLSSIELAKERRSALITAAVTGQIPVEEMSQ